MATEKYTEQTFDSFCKIVIRTESRNARGDIAAREARFLSIETIPPEEEHLISIQDNYRLYQKDFHLYGRTISVRDPDMGLALTWLMPQKRNIVLLYYFFEMNDSEIGRMLGIRPTTIRYRRESALRQLKEQIEGMEHERTGSV